MNLAHLNVGFNDIGPTGIISILKACLFPINSSSMTVLNISGSIINVEVARLLGDLLGQNCTLRELYLDRTNIGAMGERYIAAAIASNKRCGMVKLTGFDLGEVLTTLGSPVTLATMSNTKALVFLADMWRAHSDNGQHIDSGRTSSTSSSTVCDEDALQSNRRSSAVQSEVHALSTDVKLLSMSHDLALLESRAFSRAVLPIDYSIKPPADMLSQSSHLTNGTSMTSNTEQKASADHLEKYVHALREITFLPFIAADLWSLHQYYFSPAPRNQDTSDGSTSESEGESVSEDRPSRHRRVGSDRPKKKQGNKRTMARIAGYPRLKV
jgi:Leucine Rich repeat